MEVLHNIFVYSFFLYRLLFSVVTPQIVTPPPPHPPRGYVVVFINDVENGENNVYDVIKNFIKHKMGLTRGHDVILVAISSHS